jgi:DNA-binding transcriptional MerR regulator
MGAVTGLSPDALRYYEKIGVLRPVARAANGHRHYSQDDVAWIEFVLRLKHTGMPLAQIRDYARLREQGDGTIAARLHLLEQHRDSLIARIVDLRKNLNAIDSKIVRYLGALESAPVSTQRRKPHANK